jgi:hypothetical protein
MERLGNLKPLVEQRGDFINALETLSRYKSNMDWSNDPELKELGAIFDRGFKILRDEFQPALQKKIDAKYNG